MKGIKWGVTMLLLAVMLEGSGCGTSKVTLEPKQGMSVKGESIRSEDAERQAAAQTISSTQQDSQSEQPAQSVPNKAYRSAAYQGSQGDTFATDREMQALLQQAVTYFNAQPLDAILAKGSNGAPGEMVAAFPDKSIIAVYRSLKPTTAQEMPILALSIGQGVNVLNAHGLLWYENGQWHAQPYPQVPQKWQKSRSDLFQRANIGYGSFAELHQAGDKLAVIYSYSGTRMAQEVQLLQRDNGVWHIVWLPSYHDWLELLNTRIEFRGGINSFTAHHQDEKHPTVQWQDEWKLQGDRYMQVSSTKK